MEIVSATPDDAPAILALQRLAYQSEAALYDDYTIPPLTETLDDLRAEFGRQVILKAVIDDEIVGSVRGKEQQETCRIGRLIVLPGRQGQGVGTAMMREIERRFPAVSRFEVFTGHKSDRNIRLYERLGYRIQRRQVVSDKLTLVFLDKPNDAGKRR